MYILFTDTDTDITPALAKEYGYKLISMPYSIDGVTTYPYVDYDEYDVHAFFEKLRSGALPNTSAISAENYRNYFEPEFEAGNDIMYVHFSAAMSATFDVMRPVVDELLKKYPERKFYEIDTKGISILALNIVLEIGDLYKAGKSAEEIVEWAKTEVDHFAVYFFADDLKFFKHSGRVSGLAGTMGTLLGIRPIIHVNAEGKMVSIGKEKGRAKAVDRLIQYVADLGDKIEEHRVLIANSDCPDLVAEVKEELVKRFGDKLDIMVCDVNPTIGSHSGPNACGISFHSTQR